MWMAILLALSASFHPAFASASPTLSASERSELRSKLEEQFNELDLLVKNQSTDRKDLEHQNREMTELKVFERIPLEPEIPQLSKALEESASEHHLKVS